MYRQAEPSILNLFKRICHFSYECVLLPVELPLPFCSDDGNRGVGSVHDARILDLFIHGPGGSLRPTETGYGKGVPSVDSDGGCLHPRL